MPASTSPSPRSSAALERRERPRGARRQAAVRHAQAELGRAVARRDHEPGVLEQRLEVDVPDPRHVLPVGDRVVQGDDEHGGDADLERAHDLVRARRVLDQEEDDRLPAGRNPLEAPERGAEAREPGPHVLERRTERERERRGRDARCRRCRGRGARARSRSRRAGVTSRKRDEWSPRSSMSRARRRRAQDARGRNAGSGSRRDARRSRRVVVRRAAADAVLRVGGVLQARACLPRVVEPEPQRALTPVGEVADHRIVGVHDERRRLRELCDRGAPALGHELELAVAVELVAEEVPERDGARARPRERLREARPRRPRTGRARHRVRRRAPRRCRTGGSRPRGSTRAGARRRGSRRPSPSSSSCRSWPRRARRPRGVGLRAASTRSGSTFHRSFPGSVVPPPRPTARESRADRARRSGLEREAQPTWRRAYRAGRRGTLL